MKNIFLSARCFVLFLLVNTTFAQPTVSNFSPSAGKIGTILTVTGTGFSVTPADNIVFVGHIRANVTASTATTLTVTVPLRISYSNIKVNVSNLQFFSDKEFNVTFGNGESISSSTFNSTGTFTTDDSPSSIEIADIDGDGKPDIGTSIGLGTGEMSFFRNTSTSGTLSLASKVDVATSNRCADFALEDIDGDGKPDAVASNTNSATSNLQIFRNTSSSGSISFASAVNFNRPDHPFFIAVGDLNFDGKPDIVHGNLNSSNISISQNTSSSGTISLATHFNLGTGANPAVVLIEDIDGDSKRDIICSNWGANTITYFRNIHTTGGLSSSSFASVASITTGTGTNPQHLYMADIDGDGKRDLVTTHQTAGNLVIYRNTSTSGSISFATGVSYTSGTTARSAMVADINGDGKPDVVTSNIGSNTFRVFQNNSTSGTISLSTGTTFTTGTQPYYAYPVDLDGDTKMDMVVPNFTSKTIQLFRNTQLAAEPTVTSSFMSFGSITGTSMTVSWANGNGARRIVALKASTTPPTVSSPVDATEYTANSVFGSGSNLGSDWFVVYDGTGSSVNVTGLTNTQQYYCVIFEYNGMDATINYATSFASGTQVVPVEWLYVKGTYQPNNAVKLLWATAWEANNSHFDIERATEGKNFEYIARVKGAGNSMLTTHYEYTDFFTNSQVSPVYYRIKQVDFNGASDFSPIAAVRTSGEQNMQPPQVMVNASAYEIFIHPGHPDNEVNHVEVLDVRGLVMYDGKNTRNLSYSLWPAGMYLVRIVYTDDSGTELQHVSKLIRR